MKRWFIARMGDYEGDGSRVPATNKYRPNGQPKADLLNDPTVPSRVWSKQGFNWCFGQLATSDITTMQADPDIFILPDGAMDMELSAIPGGTRTTMRNRLEAAGFSFTGVQWTWSIRQLLVFLVKQLQPNIGTVEQGDVQDVTG
jgi:hypothetical protein